MLIFWYNVYGDCMYTVKEITTFEHVINKSVFICTLFPIKDNNHANEILKEVRKKYYDATHNCYAYIYGLNGEYAKNSDDGEPSQTAGIVIYDVLKKNNLTNVLAVVTRYFGGIKLGAGGLVRAYSSSTSEAVKIAKISVIEKCINILFTTSYANYNIVTKVFENYEPIDKSFTEDVNILYQIPEKELQPLLDKVKDITKNQITYKIQDSEYVEMDH